MGISIRKITLIMTQKTDYLIDLIFEKLKKNKTKEIFLEKENLEKFVFSLLEETEFKEDN